jgi:hypothetical protein
MPAMSIDQTLGRIVFVYLMCRELEILYDVFGMKKELLTQAGKP